MPALSTIKAPIDEIANMSVCMLHYLIEGQHQAIQHVSLAARPVIRQTTAPVDKKTAAA